MDSKIHTHPLHQIAASPAHKLLLKQWLKESDLIARRVSSKQTQIDDVRREITFLCSFFFVFHSLVLLLLLLSRSSSASCRRAWAPFVVSAASSAALVWAVRHKMGVERHLVRVMEREAEDGLLMERCVGELKKKGVEFDLLREVDALRRAKSLRVAANAGKGGRRGWSATNVVTWAFLAASCGVLGLTKAVVCR